MGMTKDTWCQFIGALAGAFSHLAIVFALALAAWPVRAQSPAEHQIAAQFAVLAQRANGAKDPDTMIAASEQALRLEPQIKNWPFRGTREQVRAQLFQILGEAYLRRRGATFAEDVEKAIAAYQLALGLYSAADQPEEWSTVHTNLGVAFFDRIRGEHADNIERAIAHYNAALTRTTRERFPLRWAVVQNNLGNAYRSRLRGNPA